MTAVISDLDRSGFERRLRERRERLRGEILETLLRTDKETYAELAGEVHDVEDDALADLLSDVNLAEISRGVLEIRDIDAAMRRIADRTYGLCVECGERIDPARLEAYPTAKRCLACQRTYEAHPPASPPPKL